MSYEMKGKVEWKDEHQEMLKITIEMPAAEWFVLDPEANERNLKKRENLFPSLFAAAKKLITLRNRCRQFSACIEGSLQKHSDGPYSQAARETLMGKINRMLDNIQKEDGK